jgi:DNA uptake protein ComE-like DNA-binding protein
MKKLLNLFWGYFNFTNAEKKGVVSLFIVLLLCIASTYAINFIQQKDIKVDDSTMEELANAQNSKNKSEKFQNKNENFTKTSNTNKQQFVKKQFTVDANQCDTLDLQEIRGIGSVLSKRIINYRNLLGGFVKKEQLLEVWGIDSTKYEQVKDAFIINPNSITKININNVDLQSLKKHPYLDYYQAKAIIREREKRQTFTSVEEIKSIELIDDETYIKISRYLSTE